VLCSQRLCWSPLLSGLSRASTRKPRPRKQIIKGWLESRLAPFNETVTIDGTSFSIAAVFEDRFETVSRHGYVAGLARLSHETPGSVVSNGPIVTVNPFALAEAVAEQFKTFADTMLPDMACSWRRS
jgi:hypothetical protein